MTSDINGNVTGIQGNPISSTNPEDGYVLTWNAADGYWVAQPPKTTLFQKQVFTSNGSWTAPPGVNSVTLIGYGGGGGGPGGDGGNGSNGSLTNSLNADSANPNSGAGGGGSGAANNATGNGGNGGSGKLWVLWVENK